MWYLTDDELALLNIDPMYDERFEIEPHNDGLFNIIYYNAAEDFKVIDIVDGLDRAKEILAIMAKNLNAINYVEPNNDVLNIIRQPTIPYIPNYYEVKTTPPYEIHTLPCEIICYQTSWDSFWREGEDWGSSGDITIVTEL